MQVWTYVSMHIYASMQVCTTLLKPTKNLFNKSCLGICTYDDNVDHLIWNHLVTKCSFRHNLNEATKQKTGLTLVVEEYALMMEMPYRPVNLE